MCCVSITVPLNRFAASLTIYSGMKRIIWKAANNHGAALEFALRPCTKSANHFRPDRNDVTLWRH